MGEPRPAVEGRTLPAFGLGVADPAEQQAFGVDREERAALVRRGAAPHPPLLDRGRRRPRRPPLLYRDPVRPKPVQQPPDVWLGGRAKASCGGSAASATAGCRASPRRRRSRPDGWSSRRRPTQAARHRGRALRRAGDVRADEIPELLRAGIAPAGPTSTRPSSSPSACRPCGRPRGLPRARLLQARARPAPTTRQLDRRARRCRRRRAGPAELRSCHPPARGRALPDPGQPRLRGIRRSERDQDSQLRPSCKIATMTRMMRTMLQNRLK